MKRFALLPLFSLCIPASALALPAHPWTTSSCERAPFVAEIPDDQGAAEIPPGSDDGSLSIPSPRQMRHEAPSYPSPRQMRRETPSFPSPRQMRREAPSYPSPQQMRRETPSFPSPRQLNRSLPALPALFLR